MLSASCLRKASAAAHILAMESQKAAGERFIISEKEIWEKEIWLIDLCQILIQAEIFRKVSWKPQIS